MKKKKKTQTLTPAYMCVLIILHTRVCMCPHTASLAYICVLILLLLSPIYVSSYYYCSRLYLCPHATTALAYICVLMLLRGQHTHTHTHTHSGHLYTSALILPLARVYLSSSYYHCARLYMCPHTATRSHLYIYSALILPLARVHLPPRSGWTTTKTARKQLQQHIRRRMRWQA